MKTIQLEYKIKAPVAAVWRALTDPVVINQWGAGPAKMSAYLEDFSIWGGDIHGKNIEVVDYKLLVQDWYSDDWTLPSKVTFTLLTDKDNTVVKLLHEFFPEDRYKDLKEGWEQFYLRPIKKLLEAEYKN